MTIITLRLVAVNDRPLDCPAQCRYCGHPVLQKWGTVNKVVRDTQVHQVHVVRYRCEACRRTFRHYPAGIQAADQRVRLQQLAAVCWRMGFSTRLVSGLFNVFQVPLAHMTVWRDVQQFAQQRATNLAIGGSVGSNLFNLTLIAVMDLAYQIGSILSRAQDGHILSGSLGILLIGLAASAPSDKATVFVQGSVGFSSTLTTDINGAYSAGLDLVVNPLTLTLSPAGYLTQTIAGVAG